MFFVFCFSGGGGLEGLRVEGGASGEGGGGEGGGGNYYICHNCKSE